MQVTLQDDAHVLIPNQAHQNFTRSNEVIPKGTVVNGEQRVIKGLYRGNPFEYNLFYTNKDEIIYMKHIKPKQMNKTEVTLGADAAQTPTKIELPGQSNLGKRPIIGIVVGALLGYGFAKHKKYEGKKALIAAAVGAGIGFVIAKYVQSHRDIKIAKSK